LNPAVAKTKRRGFIARNAGTHDLRDEVVGRCSANDPDVTRLVDDDAAVAAVEETYRFSKMLDELYGESGTPKALVS
jgi:hypothetical protein